MFLKGNAKKPKAILGILVRVHRTTDFMPRWLLTAVERLTYSRSFSTDYFNLWKGGGEVNPPAAGGACKKMQCRDVSAKETEHLLWNIYEAKTTAPDGIFFGILKQDADIVASYRQPLQAAWDTTRSFRVSQLPEEWKVACFIPIHKSGSKRKKVVTA